MVSTVSVCNRVVRLIQRCHFYLHTATQNHDPQYIPLTVGSILDGAE
jgi:hypothetical protein